MALIPFLEFCKDNSYGLTAAKFRYLMKQDASLEKTLHRISARGIFVDEESLQEWIANKKYYAVKRKPKKKPVSPKPAV